MEWAYYAPFVLCLIFCAGLFVRARRRPKE